MFTKVKTEEELKAMRHSGQLLAQVLKVLSRKIEPGMTTKDLAEIAKDELRSTGGQPTFLGYQGFPDVLCVSVNDEVVHGIPRNSRKIESGDIVSMDFGVTYDGMITDSAITVIVDKPLSKRHAELVADTKKALEAGISVVKDNVTVANISAAIEKILKKGNYGIVKDLVGHGVGHNLHEDPNIPNYVSNGKNIHLLKGMTIAIEPMATLGTDQVITDLDNWTIRTADGSVAAHFEHTVLVTEDTVEVLTKQ
jgi:methionyl aminopeptidase